MLLLVLLTLGGVIGGGLLALVWFQRVRAELALSGQRLLAEKDQLIARLEVEKQSLEDRLRNQKQDLDEVKEKLLLELKTAQMRALEESLPQLRAQNREQLDLLLSPFQSQLKDLSERIHRTYDVESKERVSLKKEIELLLRAQEKMSAETESLTKALRGDSKAQGDWGEITLKRVLEASGLREGQEYQEQGKGFDLRNSEGQLRKPDFLILLPEERVMIVDSKVSLSAYELFIREETEPLKEKFLKDFLASIHRHIEDLSEKDYPALYGIQSPDFTLMFVPTDGAFSLAMQSDVQLHEKAWSKRVVLVSPSLLLPILKTVEFMWRQDRQSKNAERIARAAGLLYDKFSGFLDDLEKVKTHIGHTDKALEEAFSKLKFGQGNLVRQVERLRDLGARSKKKISANWLEGAEAESEAQ